VPPSRTTKNWLERSAPIACVAIVAGALCCARPAWSAEFLTELPIQDLIAGERYTLGIRPSRMAARRTSNSKIDLYIEGLSKGASFRMVGDEIWELVWLPTVADSGVHQARVLVTERGRPTDVLEVQDLTFVVNGVPVTSPELAEPAVSDQAGRPSSAFVAVDLDAPETDTILVVPASVPAPVAGSNTSRNNAQLAESDGDTWSEFIEELDESNPQGDKPAWSLASIASRVVTPHQWVRFPVELLSDSDTVSDFVTVQIRQFQWRPGTADGGEHVFNFTAIDTNNYESRQTVTMRIIVQE